MTPELSRPIPLTRLDHPTSIMVEANQQERAAVAQRMGLPSILSLTCRFDLHPSERGSVLADGYLEARIVQNCVVSLEPFESLIEDEFTVRFVPEESEADDLDLEAEDEIPFAGTHIDLGEATSEQLGLALDPFPRKPGAELPAEMSAAAQGAFAALSKLRRPQ